MNFNIDKIFYYKDLIWVYFYLFLIAAVKFYFLNI